MTKHDVQEMIEEYGEEHPYSNEQLRAMFLAVYGRQPDTQDYDQPGGLQPLICAACGLYDEW